MASMSSMAEALSSLFTSIHCSNASLVIMLYDWLVCLDQEVACIWKPSGGLNAGSLVYALSRFPVMMSVVFSTATISPLSIPVSNLLSLFSVFRVYAVSGQKVMPTLVVSLLSTVTIITALIINGRFTKVEILPSPFNCSGVITLSSQWVFRSRRITMISRISLVAAETIVIAVTWRNRIYGLGRDSRGGETLGIILLRDGSLYFFILALLNVLHIILTALSVDEVTNKASYVTLFTDPCAWLRISTVLTCRFILNLRQVDKSRMSSTMPSGGDVEFAARGSRSTLPRFMVSFGEPLHTAVVGLEDVDEVEDIEEYSGTTDGS
ncbi:hypothetical protein V8D89_001232 [Ganoderma adspersum]